MFLQQIITHEESFLSSELKVAFFYEKSKYTKKQKIFGIVVCLFDIIEYTYC